MKKLSILALGLGIALGSVAFAQDTTPKTDDTTAKTTGHKKMKKSKKSKKTDKMDKMDDKKM